MSIFVPAVRTLFPFAGVSIDELLCVTFNATLQRGWCIGANVTVLWSFVFRLSRWLHPCHVCECLICQSTLLSCRCIPLVDVANSSVFSAELSLWGAEGPRYPLGWIHWGHPGSVGRFHSYVQFSLAQSGRRMAGHEVVRWFAEKTESPKERIIHCRRWWWQSIRVQIAWLLWKPSWHSRPGGWFSRFHARRLWERQRPAWSNITEVAAFESSNSYSIIRLFDIICRVRTLQPIRILSMKSRDTPDHVF